MKRLKVAIVGTGFGKYGHAPAIQNSESFEVLSILGSNPEKTRLACAEIGVDFRWNHIDELINDHQVDVLSVALPPKEQVDLLKRWSTQSKPVFAEKPLAVTLQDAYDLFHQYERRSTPTCVDYLFPQLKTFIEARRVLPLVDPVQEIVYDWRFMSHAHQKGLDTWKTMGRDGGGALHHFGIHALYNIEWLMGSITSLSCLHLSDTDVRVKFVIENQTPGQLILSNKDSKAQCHSIQVTGANHKLILENSKDNYIAFTMNLLNRAGGVVQSMTEPQGTSRLDPRVMPLKALFEEFALSCHGETSQAPTFQDGYRGLQLIDAIQTSFAKKQEIEVTSHE